MTKTIVFQRYEDGKFWAGGDTWVEEYPDAFQIAEEDYLWDTGELEERCWGDPYGEEDVDTDSIEEEELAQVMKIFKHNPSMYEVIATYHIGYADEDNIIYHRHDVCPETMSLKQRLLHAGLDLCEEDFDTHESDLYVKHCGPVEKWLRDNLSEVERRNLETFNSAIDRSLWYCIPFGYMPEHFDKKHTQAKEGSNE